MDFDWRQHPIRLPETLTDGVVRLDSPRLEDAEAHWSGEDFEMIHRFDAPLHRKGTLEQIRGVMVQWAEARGAGGPMFVYAIRAPEGPMAGGCELRMITADRANVSYWAYAGFRGRGLIARGVRLMSGAASAVPGLAQLEAHVDHDNAASQRVALACGFEPAGTFEGEDVVGAPVTQLLFVRTLDLWRTGHDRVRSTES